MKQSRVASFIESAVNILVGFGISLGAQIVFLPMLGVDINHTQNFIFACIMTVISLARSFILRRIFEALHIRNPLSPALLAVAAERRRQVEVECWDAAHDDKHAPGDLAAAGAAYLYAGSLTNPISRERLPRWYDKHGSEELLVLKSLWRWEWEWWKPKVDDRRRDIIRGLALGVAELDKLDRNRIRKRPSNLSAKPQLFTDIKAGLSQ